MAGTDRYQLQRFVAAQQDVFPAACAELAAGRKRSHWMWFIFPQIAGLGSSSMAQRYAIADVGEAAAYLAHPLLGERLRQCTRLVLEVEGRSVEEIFGYPDDLKFHSSMTLFQRVETGESNVFAAALQKYFSGRQDEGTLRQLEKTGPSRRS